MKSVHANSYINSMCIIAGVLQQSALNVGFISLSLKTSYGNLRYQNSFIRDFNTEFISILCANDCKLCMYIRNCCTTVFQSEFFCWAKLQKLIMCNMRAEKRVAKDIYGFERIFIVYAISWSGGSLAVSLKC